MSRTRDSVVRLAGPFSLVIAVRRRESALLQRTGVRWLRAVAYRMLGARSEADDAVQKAWLRLAGGDTGAVENLRGWLTTVVARDDAEREMLIADFIGVAVLVVLERLTPPERVGSSKLGARKISLIADAGSIGELD